MCLHTAMPSFKKDLERESALLLVIWGKMTHDELQPPRGDDSLRVLFGNAENAHQDMALDLAYSDRSFRAQLVAHHIRGNRCGCCRANRMATRTRPHHIICGRAECFCRNDDYF